MRELYIVFDDFGRIEEVFDNEKDAKDFADLTMREIRIRKTKIYENLDEVIKKDPKHFMQLAASKLDILMKEKITIKGFKSKEGFIGSHEFYLESIKEIVDDGPDKLLCHIAGFSYNDVSYEVTKSDFHLFVEKYNEVTEQIEKIKYYIKTAKMLINKENENKKVEQPAEDMEKEM